MRVDQNITVSYSYPVIFTRELFSTENRTLREVLTENASHLPRKTLAVVDNGVVEHHPQLTEGIRAYARAHHSVMHLTDILIVPGGEHVKNNPEQVEQILRFINHKKLCRHSAIMVIGGGAVIDLVGYAAAIAHRGIPLIRVPTTVLSQNDSAVGVKNGYNYFHKKNFIGTFAPPKAVLCDAGFLTTLSERDWRSGIAEAIKVALLKDAEYFDWIEKHVQDLNSRDLAVMDELNQRCAKLHLEHIASGDPFETGSSRPLDFGHWSAHKLEHLSNHHLKHGEAVAIGIALDVMYCYNKQMLAKEKCERIFACIQNLGFALSDITLVGSIDKPDSVMHGLQEFREHIGGKLTITLLQDIGKGIDVHDIDEETYKKSIYMLETYQKTQTLD